ncbi:solute carrier family 26 member 10 isoform X2 [Mycetomoellerius zeteki]|uniref:solute carrier family 26 member 10 isoform X2 n=1 Tax=Mycetomoellerius zeteki TaxID=64791 RepID=UPI00084E71D1|nr:PREDICTED: solute carrier family 26 member 10-like isoform X2 [Trachymyrmex zeteki]
MNKSSMLQIRLERPLYEHEMLNQNYDYEKPKSSLMQNAINNIKSKNWQSCIVSTVPVIQWLSQYNWREDILPDIISGLTVAIMHIPQGMAYALLGNLPPVVGIYMAFFPVFVYFLFGTSKHVSIGTFAVVCLMTGKVVTFYSNPYVGHTFANATDAVLQNFQDVTYEYTPMQVATAVTLMVGIFQIIMYTFRLGIVTTLLSETLVNSFTTAAAVYVLISQIKDLLGLKLPKQKGYFKSIFTIIDVCTEIKNSNIAAVTVSTVSIIILVVNNEYLKPRISKKYSIPIPIELIAVVGGTLVSRYCDLPKIYDIETVGHIPTGLPKPEVPSFELLPLVLIDSIAITMVSYTITVSMALIFAQKLSYEIDSNQELLAMGFSNVMGSFFSCMPISASLSRSLIQQTVGGRTQIASIVSCLLLLIILLWIGPFFELLPRCVLASIIVVALKGMFQQINQLVKFWKLSKIDAVIWIITFLVVTLINIDIGLLAGLLVSLVMILLQVIRPYTCLLGHIPHTDLYLDMGRYKAAVEIHGIKIFHYCGTLNFANNSYFKSIVYKLVGVYPQKIIKYRKKLAEEGRFLDEKNSRETCELQCIIMDMSALSYIDPSSVQVLHVIVEEFTQMNIKFYFVNCPSPIFETVKKCDLYVYGTMSLKIFATIQDAIAHFQNEIASR